MWVNVFTSKYSHSQVTSFKLHLKHNNDYTKLIFAEDHLPKHMRLTFSQRLIRFLFVPICFIAIMCLMHAKGVYKDIDTFCGRRDSCFASCITSNFPTFNCVSKEFEIDYDGNSYRKFFFFPKPLSGEDNKLYNTCKSYINDNPTMARAGEDSNRALRAHTCFKACQNYGDCLSGFDMDDRPMCSLQESETGIICVDP